MALSSPLGSRINCSPLQKREKQTMRRSGCSSAQTILRIAEVRHRGSCCCCCCCSSSSSNRISSDWASRSRRSRGGEGRGGGGGEEKEQEGERWRSREISNQYKSTAMSNRGETAAIAQAEAAGREAAKAAAAEANGGGGGGGRGAGKGGDEKAAAQQQSNGAPPVGEKSGEMAVSFDDATHGFTRPEMHTESLVGTVQYFERHLFLCCKGPESWPSTVEAASEQFDRLPNRLAGALKARKNDVPLKTRLTICEECAGPDSSSAGDVLVFPDMVRYKGLTEVDVDQFVEDALVGGKEWKSSGSGPETLSGSYVFVCSHASRDKRCGSCGPVLIEKLKDEIRARGLEDEIFVRACSHIGGHKYAGNVIVFSSSGTGAVAGHWYGYVAPADVPLILDQHIGRGEIIERLWRGQMGVNEGDSKVAQQNRLGSGEGGANTCCQSSSSPAQANGGNQCGGGSGCCQLSNERAVKEVKENRIPDFLVSAGSSAHDGHLIFPEDDDTDEEPVDPRLHLWGNYYIPLPKWVQTWEKEDTNAALAIVGAAAAVAVAVHLWREAASSSSSS